MSDELFERYLRNDLDESGALELGTLLESQEGAEAFREFVQEWTLLGEAARTRVAEAGRVGTRTLRKRSATPTLSRAGIGWGIGVAAALLFMLGLVLSTQPVPESRPLGAKGMPPAPPPIVEPELKPESVPMPFPRTEALPPPPPAPMPIPAPVPQPRQPADPAPVTPPAPPAPAPRSDPPTRVALADVECLQGGGVLLTSKAGSR